MAAKPETTFIGSVHRHLPMRLYRVKNHNEYASGVADCWYSGASDLWVEYKFLTLPKRASTLIDLVGGKNPALSHLQQEWLRSRYEEGRSVWVIVGCTAGGVIFEDMAWEKPIATGDFMSLLQDRRGLAAEIAKFTEVPM